MITAAKAAPELADLIDRHHEAIVAAWIDLAHGLADSHYRQMPEDELRAAVSRSLAAIAAALRTGSYTVLDGYLAEISRTRLSQGFAIGEVIAGLLLWQEAALPVIWAEMPSGSPQAREAILDLGTCLRYILGRFGELFAQAMHRDLQEEQKRTSLMLHAVQMASGSLELGHVLERLAEALVGAVGVRSCGIYLFDAERGVLVPQAAAGDLSVDQLAVFRARQLDPAQEPLVREALEGQEPVACCDAMGDPRISRETAQAFGGNPVLAVPIKIAERVLGMAVVSTSDDYHCFVPEEIALAAGIANAVALAIDNARLYDETSRRLAESQSLQRVTAALLQQLSLEEVLEIVCAEAEQLTGALGSTVFLFEEPDRLRVAFSSGTGPTSLDRIAVGESFTGMAVQQGRPLVTNDPSREPQGCYGDATPSSVLAVPLRVKEAAIGALDLANKPGGFAEEDVRIMSLFADQAAIAIENARLHQQVEQLAVVEERQRLARELHDSVTQSLYSVSLYAEAAARLLVAGNQSLAAEHLRELRDTAQEALREMRLLIFELRPPVLQKEGLVAALQTRLEAVEARAGLRADLVVEGEATLSPAVEEELYRIAREALNNVLKHAKAQQVAVGLLFRAAGLTLEVRDDGQGFDPASASEKGGLGLRGMDERARRIGGKLLIESAPGQGACVRLVVEREVATQ